MCTCERSSNMEDGNWRQTVTNVSDKIFPGLSAYSNLQQGVNFVNIVWKFCLIIGNEYACSLPLQMSLYFNVVFFPFWLISSIIMLNAKFDCLSIMFQFILVMVLVIMIGIESLRLYLGYLGNLMEQLPELASFLMVSVLLQLPLQLFLLVNQNVLPQPLEYAIQGVMLVLLVVQIVSASVALRNAASYQSLQFRRRHIIAHKDLATNDRPKVE